MLQVNEIFKSIQGEGLLAGVPTTFVRLHGCNLNCKWCDTGYSKGSSPFQEMHITEICSRVKKAPTKKENWVCITGGEPLFQESELSKLVAFLNLDNYNITIETNGTYPIPNWKNLITSWNADIKCPSSGEGGKSLDEWFNLPPINQVKFVVEDRQDLIFVSETLERNANRTSTVLVSPCIRFDLNGEINKKSKEWFPTVASFCVEMNVIFSLQIHKVIWGNKKGV